jgi:hypothetical protein
LATSFGSIGALLPEEVGNFVQIGVSMTPGVDGVDPDTVTGRGTLHRDGFREQAYASLRGAIAGQTGRPRRPATDDMIMMEPPPARRSAGTAYFTERNTPSRFTAVCRRQSTNDISIALVRTVVPTDIRLPRGGGGKVSRTRKSLVKAVSDDEVGALLDHYRCPVPFHTVRTWFLGDIASPVMSASPLDAVKALWGGELPEFDSLNAINELLRILVMGLWNGLARHQERSAPFRLVRVEIPATREGLVRIALIRREELDGFVEGVFGKEQSLELPERAHRALDALSELRSIFDGLYELAGNPTKPVTADDIVQIRQHIRELTKVGEREIHEAVLSCTRARRQLLSSLPTAKPTLH